MVPNANPIWSTHNANYKSPEEYRTESLQSSALAGICRGFQLLLESQGSELRQLVKFHKSWYEMVEQYAGRNLTKESDKIPALLGVADFIEKSSAWECIAGLWWECLSINLPWNVKTATGSARSSFPAPTWSWVSIRGGVETQLQHVKTESQNTTIHYLMSFQGCENISRHNWRITNAGLKMPARICDFSKFNPQVILDRPDAEPEVSLTRSEAYVPMLKFDGVSTTERESSEIHGLIVKRTLYLRDDFERIGNFSM
ncbi:hypothetical protein BGZ61DRAFT_476729 [Ilyonectria robusta]|uniref:uncharacterized protein n=1 Tax=Ilyonectria robusta TaxID=1079257 RepID=UPI001E8CB7C7|nr:uncharacterized protein BGZ61DRAFT_476729 [Ilyonectria robusta]KAH8714679.1 hypothetical protein BGZ61DRAFT_476729 [Ilyonectria robusta]